MASKRDCRHSTARWYRDASYGPGCHRCRACDARVRASRSTARRARHRSEQRHRPQGHGAARGERLLRLRRRACAEGSRRSQRDQERAGREARRHVGGRHRRRRRDGHEGGKGPLRRREQRGRRRRRAAHRARGEGPRLHLQRQHVRSVPHHEGVRAAAARVEGAGRQYQFAQRHRRQPDDRTRTA